MRSIRSRVKENVVSAALVVLAVSIPVPGAAQGYGAQVLAPDPSRVIYAVRPNDADAEVKRYLDRNVIIFKQSTPATAPLLVFMPGTGGNPEHLLRFLDAASNAGYRAIGLMYDDVPAVNVVCPRNPDPECNAHFRQKRIFGDDVTSVIDDTRAESIVNRLTKLLDYLSEHDPSQGWNTYLLPDGSPNWARIAVGGHSQGAGMAAFIAKKELVYRVVLFSSPWDFQGREQLSAWLSEPSATPMDRWYAAYHTHEPMAPLIQRAYAALGIPKSQIRAFDLEPNLNYSASVPGLQIYHVSTVGDFTTPLDSHGNPAYLSDWLFLLGHPSGESAR